MEPEIDLLAFDQGTITAPAGCGKTHLIAHALSRHAGRKPVLVLTHTNAGVAALRGRLERAQVATSAYRLATIDGWAMRLLTLFPRRSGHDPEILTLSQARQHYPAIRIAARGLLMTGHINDVLAATYDRLIVDEYQDCSVVQHEIVANASAALRTCVLGDPLQAIFNFAGPTADWEAQVKPQFPDAGELATPWRWINVGEEAFGRWLLEMRHLLQARGAVDLRTAPANVSWVQLDGVNDHRLRLGAGSTRPSVADGRVLIMADSTNPDAQRNFAGQIPGGVVVENVDMRDLVAFGENFDLASPTIVEHVISFAGSVMTNVGAAAMIQRLVTLRSGRARIAPTGAEEVALRFAEAPSYAAAADLLSVINSQGGVRAHRPAILRGAYDMLKACRGRDGVTPADAATAVRERSRLVGRPLATRTVGSTLLLKGLEADVAVILNPSVMDHRHLYVAMTRGARQLIVCSSTPIITPA
ncbi:UvrD-helicase domain-containing protein [Methylobacterium sp. C25]|uniref:UvrD-helicase domain-containing protein n=1 Tax=Methylobacterium sp. C25 TaxID=2721622 RepID=UPI001F17BDF3|nr:UvrD-helicase domain-containing protein [Methylobacterium sp. C25]MCE4223639.1 UvrD-helicase domain-containing protein [Methylobacterium sp. C25]